VLKEVAHQSILDLSEPVAQAKQFAQPQIDLFADLAAYGSNLVIRAFNSSPREMAEIIVCGVHLKQVVAMVDATQVLVAAGCSHAANLPARAGWEAALYLDWILSGSSERRATCYLVGNYRDEREWCKRVTPGTAEEAAFSEISKSIGIDFATTRPTLASDAATRVAEVDRILAQPSLAAIDKEFDQKRAKKKYDPQWYELDGMQSIRQIATSLGRAAEYQAFYSKGSQVTHTGSYKDHIVFADGEVRFKPIRHLADVNSLTTFVAVTAMGAYRRVLVRYRPGEVMAFDRKYVSDWRQALLNPPELTYNF